MEEILHQLRLLVYPIIYRVLYIPVVLKFSPPLTFFVQTRRYEVAVQPAFGGKSCQHPLEDGTKRSGATGQLSSMVVEMVPLKGGIGSIEPTRRQGL